MGYASKDQILAQLVLAERDEESVPLGGGLRLRELRRAQILEIRAWASAADRDDQRTDRWHAALFADGVIDPNTKAPLFTREEVLTWPSRAPLWDEIVRIDQIILDLGEVGAEHLKKESLPSSPATD